MLFGLVDISWPELQWNQMANSNLNHDACYPEFLVVFSVPPGNATTVLKLHCDHYFQIISNSSSPIILPYNTMQPKKLTASFNKATNKNTAGKRRKPQVVLPAIFSWPQYNTQSNQLSFFKVLYMFRICALKNLV
jgi:hypothetical protein